jgi:hypothetical protein
MLERPVQFSFMTPLPIFLATIIPGAGTLVVSFTIVGKSRHLARSHLAKDHQRTTHDGEGVRTHFCTFSLVLS